MSNTVKILGIIIMALLLAVVFTGFLWSNIQNVMGITRTADQGFQDQEYLVSASSSATVRTDSHLIAGAERVTLFLANEFHTDVTEQTATFSVEVSDVPEPSNGSTLVGTTTPFTIPYNNALVSTLDVGTSSPFLLANETIATTTITLDLRQFTYPFLRVIKTGTTADAATTTISIIKQY